MTRDEVLTKDEAFRVMRVRLPQTSWRDYDMLIKLVQQLQVINQLIDDLEPPITYGAVVDAVTVYQVTQKFVEAA